MLLVLTVIHRESDAHLKISEVIMMRPGPLTWEIPDSNSSGFSPLGFTILALVLNMAFVSVKRNEDNMRVTDRHGSWTGSCTPSERGEAMCKLVQC